MAQVHALAALPADDHLLYLEPARGGQCSLGRASNINFDLRCISLIVLFGRPWSAWQCQRLAVRSGHAIISPLLQDMICMLWQPEKCKAMMSYTCHAQIKMGQN